jgi:hypothetical protein
MMTDGRVFKQGLCRHCAFRRLESSMRVSGDLLGEAWLAMTISRVGAN